MEKGPKFSNRGGSDESTFLSRGEARQADQYGVSTREEYLNILADKDYDKLSNFERATLESATLPTPASQEAEPVDSTEAIEDVAKTIQEVAKSKEVSLLPAVQEVKPEDFKAAIDLNAKIDEDLKKIDEKYAKEDIKKDAAIETPKTNAVESKEKKGWFSRLKKSKLGKLAITTAATLFVFGGGYALGNHNSSESAEQDRTEQTDTGSTFNLDSQTRPLGLSGEELSESIEAQESTTSEEDTAKEDAETEKNQEGRGNFYDENKDSYYDFGSAIEEGETARDTLNNLIERFTTDNITAVALQSHHLDLPSLEGKSYEEVEEYLNGMDKDSQQEFIDGIIAELNSKDENGEDIYDVEVSDIEGSFDSSYEYEDENGVLRGAKSKGLNHGGRKLTITNKQTGKQSHYRLNCGGQPIVMLSGGTIVELPGDEIPAKEVTPTPTPEIPSKPETPETPETPEKPTEPEEPTTPKTPEEPETPEAPEPEFPEEPEEPEEPETPPEETDDSKDYDQSPEGWDDNQEIMDSGDLTESDKEIIGDKETIDGTETPGSSIEADQEVLAPGAEEVPAEERAEENLPPVEEGANGEAGLNYTEEWQEQQEQQAEQQAVQDEANNNEITTGGETTELESGTTLTRDEILASQGLNPDGTPIEE